MLHKQFLLGLRDGPIRQQLKAQLRREPELSFEKVRKEAMALEADRIEPDDASTCTAATSTAAAVPSTVADWKQQLWSEILKDVREQMAELLKTIMEELLSRSSVASRLRREWSHSEGAATDCRPPTQPAASWFQWDAQAHPICSK